MSRKEKEAKISEFWQKHRIFEKSVEQRPESKQYVFYDGPPFATGLPHYGHILGLTSKDVFPRYWTMKGYRVERRWGWDCHGLPVENIAEKELGIKDKKEIESMGIDKFNEFCRSKVLYFAEEWKKTVDRMGKWIDFDNSYKTMDNTYMETVWHLFKKLYDSGYIYEGKKVLLYCPRCQTPLANAEIAMDNSYRDVTEKSATVKFKIKGQELTYVLAWTTTPWTLIGNVALAVNPELTYVKAKVPLGFYIVARDRLDELDERYEIIEEFKGERLLGLEYEPLYYIPSSKRGYYIINGGDAVTATEGTGIVHMALYGEFDHEMIKKYDLPVIQHIGNHGKLVHGPEEWIGTWFKTADKLVLGNLDNRSLIYKEFNYTHSYPFCYRCDTPLFYNAVDSWFVNIQKIKPSLLEKNEEINWYPSHIKNGRFKDIIETAPDWSISRNRYWATSIPVWKCTKQGCHNITVIGSIKELQVRAIEEVPGDVDLHKHVMDKIHLKCARCKGTMNRIPEVMDCWFESGSMPYAAKHYPFENVNWFKDNFPADFISEYIAQVRAWFYYMHVISVLMFDRAPFKNVVVSGNVLAEDGTKMSKSKNNFPDPNMIFDKYGADSLRFYLMQSPLMKAQDLNFSEEGVKETFRRVLTLLENIAKFYELYGKENKTLDNKESEDILDKWIVSRTQTLVRDMTNSLDAYDATDACTQLISFIEELSTWYVRRSRSRFKSEEGPERTDAIQTLAYVLNTLSRLVAPTMPFIAEEIHQIFRESNKSLKESVHLEEWPTPDPELIDEKLHANMKKTREIVSIALDEREKAKMPIRQVLNKLTIKGEKIELPIEYLEIIKEELNVKHIEIKPPRQPTTEITVEIDTTLTPDLQQEGISRDLIRKINGYRKQKNLTIKDRILLYLETDDALIKESFRRHETEILKQVQADKATAKKEEDLETMEIQVNKSPVHIGIRIIK